jgi:FkbM family methyltransferase
LNPIWFLRNVATSWRHGASLADVVRNLLLSYSAKLPPGIRRDEWTIGFRYPKPIGDIRLLLRANGGADAFTHSEVFEHQYYRLPLQRPPATILDLGANIGLSAIYFARTFPGARLACVEPVAENLQVLVANLKLNGVQAEVISAAVDVTDGMVWMERSKMDYAHRLAARPGPSSAGYFEVPAISVTSILRHLGWSRIGLLKVDVEGHERKLLSDDCDWLQLVDSMCLEYHEELGESELTRLAMRFRFLTPKRLPGAIWFLTRAEPVQPPSV